MLFKDLYAGDVFKLIKGDTTFIKISSVNDNEYPFRRYYNYPSNVLIIDKLHYGVISPMAEVYRIKEYHGKEQEKTPLKKLIEKHKSDIHRQNFMTYGGVPYDKISKDALHYTEVDVRSTMAFLELCQEYQKVSFPGVKKVIFNDPATIVIWSDGSKTVVKCQGDEKFDPEKGLALCFMKKALGNKSNFNNVFREWITPESTCFYDEDHPELGIQELPRGRKILPTGRLRIKKEDTRIMAKYMYNHKITILGLARYAGLSVRTVRRALNGLPVMPNTIDRICKYFDFPIETTIYVED